MLIIITINNYYCYCCYDCCCCRLEFLLLGLLVLRPSISSLLRQPILLQSAIAFLLQGAAILLQSAMGTTKCDH